MVLAGSTSVAYYSRSWIEFPFVISAVYIYLPLGVLVVFKSNKLGRTTEGACLNISFL